MHRHICTDGVLLSLLLICITRQLDDVSCRMMIHGKINKIRDAGSQPCNHQQSANIEKQTAENSTSTTALCYDATNKAHLRLWPGNAPGAVDNDPCKDIPFLRVFYPNDSAPCTDTGIIIIPGGGYDTLIDLKEQAPVAQYFANTIGTLLTNYSNNRTKINFAFIFLGAVAFILYYRLALKSGGGYVYPVQMWDGQRALRYVRFNALQYNINPKHVGIFGFSAGGHLASTIALHFDQNFGVPNQDDLDKVNARPDFLGLGYPVISMDPQQYASNNSLKHLLYGYTGNKLAYLEDFLSGQKNVGPLTPPTFIFESLDDQQISPQNSVLFIKALENASIPHDAHLFQQGKHGDGLAVGEGKESIWPELFHKWLVTMEFISSV